MLGRRSTSPVPAALASAYLAAACAGPGSNAPPELAAVTDQQTSSGAPLEVSVTLEGGASSALSFDAESSDPTVVPASGVEVTGSGAERTLHVEPTTLGTGTVDVTLTARNEAGEDSVTFAVEVRPPFDAAPDELRASVGASGDQFGRAVAVAADQLVVGADYADGATGGAYVFHLVGGAWTEVAEIGASDGANLDRFGVAVATDSDLIVVGARGKDIAAGGAYLFERSGGEWSEVDAVSLGDGAQDDLFGTDVALDGERVLIGASGRDDAGAAYVLERQRGGWGVVAELTAPDAAADDRFGASVELDGDHAIVGAPRHDSGTGSAYVFRRGGGSWRHVATLAADSPETGEAFGASVALAGDHALVGADGDERQAMNGGAVYAFRRSGDTWSRYDVIGAHVEADDAFGGALELGGDVAVVGAPGEDAFTGAAYVFLRSGDAWHRANRLGAGVAAANDTFGWDVALHGDRAVVSAHGTDSYVGAVHAYER